MGLFDSFKKFVGEIFGAIGDVLGYVLGIDPDAADQYKGQLINKNSNIGKIPVIYGERLVGGTRVFVSTGGNNKNEYLYIALVLSEGEVEEIGDVYINDVISTDERYGISTEYKSGGIAGGLIERLLGGKITIEKYTGKDNQEATDLFDGANDDWTSAHQLKGVAYLAVRVKYDQDLFTSIPEIRAVVKGRKVYDPRTQTTAWSDNPALCLRDYLTNARYGKGLPVSAIDENSIIQAANDCETLVTPYNGAQQFQLFKYNAIVDTGETLFDNVKKILASMRGILPYSNGKYSLLVDKDQQSTFTLNEDNILSEIKVVSSSKEDKYNQVTAKFPNPEKRWELDTVTYPDAGSTEETAFLTEDNQQILSKEITLHNVTNIYRAKDLARIACLASRKQSLTVSVTCTTDALNIAVGDIVTLEHESLGWTGAAAQEFRVMGMVLDDSGEVDLTLQQYDSSIYPWVEQSEANQGPETTLPDPYKTDPIVNPVSTGSAIINPDGSTSYFYDVEWDAPDDALVEYYLIEVNKTQNGSTTLAAETLQTQNLSYRYVVSDTSIDYGFTVIAVNGAGTRSAPVDITPVEVIVDTTPPAQPTETSVTGTFKQIIIEWTNPTDSDFSHVEIKRSADNNEVNAAYISQISGERFIDGQFDGVVTYYYWIRSVDNSGNPSDWLSVGGGTSLQLANNDFADGVIIPDYLDTSTQAILTSVENYDTDISNINTNITNLDTDIQAVELDVSTRALDSDLQNITQQLDDNLTTASERLLTMSLFASEQAGIMRDAGITVDPDNGSVSIQAVEQLRTDTDQQLTQVGLEIDAIDGQLGLYATRTFVESEIAEAQLDPTEFTAFTDLQARVNQAEIDIDANTASVTLKADQTELDSLDVRLSQAEIDIDGAEASIALKANQSDFTDLQTRITSAEIQLDAIDAPSITQTVVDVSNLTHRMANAEVQDLNQLLEIYDTRQTLQQDIAFARTQITADVTDIRESIATQRTELGALIDANSASLISEQTARANADSAITEDITQLRTDLTTAEGEITGNASAITSLDGRVTTAEGSITSQATDITSLQSSVTDLETDTTANATAISGLNTRVTSNETSITSQSTDITNLQTSLTTTQGDVTNNANAITTNATAITNLDTRVTTAEGTITSQSTDITNLQSSVTNLGTDTGNNATAISTLDTRVSQTETDISTQSTAITDLTTSVNEKIITFSQNDEPTQNLTTGDLWLDTNDNNKLYRYSGTEWVEVSDNRIADTATALTQLTTTVTQNGTDITAISQDVTELRTDVNNNTSEIVSVAETASSETRASAKRLEQLVTGQAQTQLTEILNRESNQEFLSSEVAIVRSDFNAVTQANLESIAQTRTDLTALINGNSADITSEQLTRASADQALASDINSLRADLTTAEGNITGNADATTLLTARVDVTENDITSISADVTTLQSELDIAESGVTANAGAISALDTRVTSAEGSITSQATDITELETDLTNANTNITANSTAITNLDTRVTSTENTITSQSTSITSLSSSVGDLETAVGDLETDTTANATAITGLSTTVTAQGTSISTNATAISNLSTTVDGNTTNISTLQTTTDGIKGQYSVTINNNGTVSGFGLVSDIIDGEPTSAFNVSADQFSITSSSVGEVWDSETSYSTGDTVYYLGVQYEAIRQNSNKIPDANTEDWENTTSYPFTVYTADTVIEKGGQDITIPKGVYIQDAFIQAASINTANIQDAAITNAKINDLNASKINAGFISADRIESGSIDAKIANIGWAKITDVSIVDADISNLTAEKITAGTLSSDRLSIDNATIDTNGNGQLIIKDLGVSTIKIADQAVTIPSSTYSSGDVSIAQTTGAFNTTVQTVVYTSTGAPVQLNFVCGLDISVSFSGSVTVTFALYRGNTLIQEFVGSSGASDFETSVAIAYIDNNDTAGERTYTIKARRTGGEGAIASKRSLTALEVKK